MAGATAGPAGAMAGAGAAGAIAFGAAAPVPWPQAAGTARIAARTSRCTITFSFMSSLLSLNGSRAPPSDRAAAGFHGAQYYVASRRLDDGRRFTARRA